MVNTTLNVAGFVLLAWLVIGAAGTQSQQLQHLPSEARTLKQPYPEVVERGDATTPVVERLDVIEEHIAAQQYSQKQLAKSVNEVAVLTKQLSKQAELLKLHRAYLEINRAQRLHKNDEFEAASKRLLKSKQVIWDAGEYFTDYKGHLHGLMQTIDHVSSSWSEQKQNESAKPISDVLEDILMLRGDNT